MYFTNTCMFNTCGSDCTTKVHTTVLVPSYNIKCTPLLLLHIHTYTYILHTCTTCIIHVCTLRTTYYCAHMSCHVGTHVVCHVCTTVLLNYYLLLATILLVLTLLTRRPCHLSTTQNMKVQVIDTLTPQRPIIHNNSITFVQILHVGYFRSSYHKFS